MILVFTEKQSSTDSYIQSRPSDFQQVNYSEITTIIIEGNDKQVFEITHFLSKKFLLDKITIAYANQNIETLDLDRLRSIGISQFGLSVASLIIFFTANNQGERKIAAR
jgi:hypothetical protein